MRARCVRNLSLSRGRVPCVVFKKKKIQEKKTSSHPCQHLANLFTRGIGNFFLSNTEASFVLAVVKSFLALTTDLTHILPGKEPPVPWTYRKILDKRNLQTFFRLFFFSWESFFFLLLLFQRTRWTRAKRQSHPLHFPSIQILNWVQLYLFFFVTCCKVYLMYVLVIYE